MAWQPSPEWLIQAFDGLVPELPGVERRKMFGYPCAFAEGNMFIGLHQDRLVLRLPKSERERFLDLYETSLFTPFPGRTMREYVVVPRELIAERSDLEPWIEIARGYAASLGGKKGRRKKGPAGRSGRGDRSQAQEDA